MIRILILLILFTGKLSAQLVFGLSDVNYDFKADEYYIAAVQDLRSQPGSIIGNSLTNSHNKNDIRLSTSVSSEFSRHLQKSLKQDLNGIPLILKITELYIREKVVNQQLISGEASLKMEIFGIKGSDTSLICKPYASNKFTRTYNSANEENYEPVVRNMLKSCMSYNQRYINESKSRIPLFVENAEIIIEPFYRKNARDTVYYQDRKVTWADFKGEPSLHSKYAAAIFPSISFDSRFEIKDRKIKALVTPRVYMIQSMSWVKDKARNEYSLAHEQLHFDIAMLVMYKLLERIKNLQADNMDDLQSMIHFEYLEAYRELHRIQEDYDNESNHSIDVIAQKNWENKINREMNIYR